MTQDPIGTLETIPGKCDSQDCCAEASPGDARQGPQGVRGTPSSLRVSCGLQAGCALVGHSLGCPVAVLLPAPPQLCMHTVAVSTMAGLRKAQVIAVAIASAGMSMCESSTSSLQRL